MVLVIGGHIRSGTTLLRNLCNSHPEIEITNEFNYFSGLGKSYTEHRRILLKRLWGETKSRGIKLPSLFGDYAFVTRYLFKIRGFRQNTIDAIAIESTLRSIFPKAHIIGDKTPRYVFLLDKLVAERGLSNLVIFRDCRDVASSVLVRIRSKWRKKHWKYNVDTAEKIAGRWVRGIEIMERNKDKIHIIRYEDLVLEPKRELIKLAKWLGVDPAGFSDSMVSNIRKRCIGKYKTALTKEELRTVMAIAGPMMEKLGYI